MSGANSKRKHVTSACQPCRDSKIRCDGATPICGNCSKKEKECVYVKNDDKRRVSLRSAIDILADRVVVLTDTLTQHGVAVPQMNSQQEKTLSEICETLKISLPEVRGLNEGYTIPHEPNEPGLIESEPDITAWQNSVVSNTQTLSAATSQPQGQAAHASGPLLLASDGQDTLSVSDGPLTDGTPADWPWHVFESNAFLLSDSIGNDVFGNNLPNMQHTLDPVISIPTSYPQEGGSREVQSSDEEHDSDLVHQVSARFGALRISSDGQLRYYGAATNYHLLEGSRHDEDVELVTTKQEMLDRLEQAGLNQDVPAELENNLLDLYFAWHNPTHINIDRDTFMAARAEQEPSITGAGYCTDFLINAMYDYRRCCSKTSTDNNADVLWAQRMRLAIIPHL